jgi:hypothetical protein
VSLDHANNPKMAVMAGYATFGFPALSEVSDISINLIF